MPETFNLVSALIIRELTGDKRALTLTGRALPYRGVAFASEMRAEFSWYPGNPEATVQVLGAKENETVLRGMWKDRFLADRSLVQTGTIPGAAAFDLRPPAQVSFRGGLSTSPLLTAMDLVKQVNDIQRSGQLLEVTWDEIGRRGILTKFVHTWQNRRDVEWEMTFQWVNQAEDAAASVFTVEIDVRDVGASWADQLAQLQAAAQAPFASIQEFTDAVRAGVNQVKQGVNAINSTVAGVVGTVQGATGALLAPIAAARSVLGVVQTLKDAARTLVTTIETFPDAVAAGLEGLANQAVATFGAPGTQGQSSNTNLSSINAGAPTTASGGASNPQQAAASASASQPVPGSPPSPGTPASIVASSLTNTASVSTSLNATSARAPGSVPVGLRLQAANYQRGLLRVARQMLSLAARQQAEIQKRVAPDLLASFTARADTDLREVSIQFYGTQDEWKNLMLFNQMTSSRLSAGQLVFVPNIRGANG